MDCDAPENIKVAYHVNKDSFHLLLSLPQWVFTGASFFIFFFFAPPLVPSLCVSSPIWFLKPSRGEESKVTTASATLSDAMDNRMMWWKTQRLWISPSLLSTLLWPLSQWLEKKFPSYAWCLDGISIKWRNLPGMVCRVCSKAFTSLPRATSFLCFITTVHVFDVTFWLPRLDDVNEM